MEDVTDIEQRYARLVAGLCERFGAVHDPRTVAQVVAEERARLESQARVTAYLPVLVARRAVDQLTGREQVVLAPPPPAPDIDLDAPVAPPVPIALRAGIAAGDVMTATRS